MEQAVTRKKAAGTPRLRFPIKSPIAFCQGCLHPLVGRIIAENVEELGIEGDTVLVGGVGCHAVIVGHLNLDVLLPGAAHGRAPDVATGAKRILGKRAILITIQGDGDAMAIGTEPLIQAAARGERITVIMINNQVYGTTGGQLAPTTIIGHPTTTTAGGRKSEEGYPVHTAELLAKLHGVVYSARGALNSVRNLQRTKKYVKAAIAKQMDDRGFSFVEILGNCPVNWRMTPINSVKYIEEKLIPEFPLGEFKNIKEVN
ncbi:MAG: thiamine pyrophosphate-dependent enzyme [Syntrophales bacterium]|nr:thiamine pyrophosphate-dependent enzyme [Syntrophales bacterium]